ncbi:MAG: FAD-binding oxidoreductase, partial [Gammaproteobacteria bacterium]|nr:FAD-binding oxidoreductase [Gammaproteobacteria bacterium]
MTAARLYDDNLYRFNVPQTSYWEATGGRETFTSAPLDSNESCDVAIIGGGYTGLSAALHLARDHGVDVRVLEAGHIGWGASGRNGGHVGTGQRADQYTLETLVGKPAAQQLWAFSLEAVDTVCGLIDEFAIDCELKRGDLYLAHTARAAREEAEDVERMQAEYGYDKLRYVDSAELSEMTSAQGFHGGSLDQGARHLHPLKYCLGLARAADGLGVTLHESSRVTGYREGDAVRVQTDQGCVHCDFLVVACNGYLDKLDSRLAGQIMPINNYMLATEPLDEALARRVSRDDTSMADSRFVINYWKLSADKRLLFGGGETYT